AQGGGVGGQATPDPIDRSKVLPGLTGGQVDDLGTVEAGQVDGLVELGAQPVQPGTQQPQPGIGVEVADPGDQGPDAHAVQQSGLVALHPAEVGEGLQQGVGAAARDGGRGDDLADAGWSVLS